MIPYKDDNPTRRFPILTVALIALNSVVFLYEIFNPFGMQGVVFKYGAIPHSLITFQTTQPINPVLSIFTAMFLHGGVLHIAGNMLYLWIFGNNIEDSLGRPRFLIFYFMCGVVAAYAHTVSNTASMIPMIGASGAVSGVLGAYLFLFPKARVYTIVFLGIFIQVVRLPALIVIGFWAIIQVVNSLISSAAEQGGIAWFAHVGGFLFGFFFIKLLMPGKRRF